MSTTLLPELAAESVETAERLAQLLVEADLDAAEAEYLLASRLAAIRLVPRLWPIIRTRIAGGIEGSRAQPLLSRMLEAVDRNLTLAARLKEPARIVGEEGSTESEDAVELAAAEKQLREIRGAVLRLLKIVDAPSRWPGEEQLRQAKERMTVGERLSAEEFRQAMLDG